MKTFLALGIGLGLLCAAPATSSAPTMTPTPTPAPAQQPAVLPVKPGLHQTQEGKYYYIKKNGKKAIGYKKVNNSYYYFKKNGYAVTSAWKYVKIGKTKYKLYFKQNGKRKMDVSGMMKSTTKYHIQVYLDKNMVMIYAKDGNKGYTIPVKSMICSAGMPGHSTITGTYSRLIKSGKWRVLRYSSYGQYCTRIHGPYLFHSVVYTRYGDKYSLDAKEYKKLGKNASHGCIRLPVKDAKWIYDHAGNAYTTIYKTFGKKIPNSCPKAEKIGKTKNGYYYDPSDPNV